VNVKHIILLSSSDLEQLEKAMLSSKGLLLL
jgi:hypothetical protein